MQIEKSVDGKIRISSGSTFESMASYSRCVIDGEWVFISGTTGFDYDTMTIDEDVVAQAYQAFSNIKESLSVAGATLDDIVKVNYYFSNRDDVPRVAPLVKELLKGARPAATYLIVGLLFPSMKIEIEATAHIKTF